MSDLDWFRLFSAEVPVDDLDLDTWTEQKGWKKGHLGKRSSKMIHYFLFYFDSVTISYQWWVQFNGYCINKCKQIVYIFVDKLIDGADHEVELLEALEVNVSISFNFLTWKSLIHKNDL